MTAPPQFSANIRQPEWIIIEEGFYEYSGIGGVSFHYIPLAPLKFNVADLPPRTQFHRYGKPVSATKNFTISLKRFHGIVTDFSLRPKWIFGLRFVEDQSDQLNTIGSEHLCILPTNRMEFKITSQHIAEGIIEYVEQSNSVKWLAPLNQVFVLERISNGTSRLTVHIHYRKNWLSKCYLDFPLRMMMAMMLRISLSKLRRYVSKLPVA